MELVRFWLRILSYGHAPVHGFVNVNVHILENRAACLAVGLDNMRSKLRGQGPAAVIPG